MLLGTGSLVVLVLLDVTPLASLWAGEGTHAPSFRKCGWSTGPYFTTFRVFLAEAAPLKSLLPE
jgi:hypothetical protein